VTDLSFFTSPLSQEIRTEGRVETKIKDILMLLDGRGVPVSDADRHRITSCDDLDTLDRWFARAITATSTSEVLDADQPDTEG